MNNILGTYNVFVKSWLRSRCARWGRVIDPDARSFPASRYPIRIVQKNILSYIPIKYIFMLYEMVLRLAFLKVSCVELICGK